MSEILDVRGEICPQPLIRLRRCLRLLSLGDRIKMIADDPTTLRDVPYYCEYTGHKLIEIDNRLADEKCIIFHIAY